MSADKVETEAGESIVSSASAGVLTRRPLLTDIAQVIFFTLLVWPFLTLFIGLRVRGRAHLPKSDPFILLANHASHLDTISLLSLFSLLRLRNIRPVAAADYFQRNRIVALFSQTLFNILPIARKGITRENNPLRQMQSALECGQSLIIFPEGTRGSGEEVGQFKAGIAKLIERVPEVSVVPALLINMGRSLPKGEFIPVPFFCEIRLGKPCKLTGTQEEILQALESAVRDLKELH
jgi:1-acyl-sn-glycerol-3-phosphate acyltransferase